MPPPALSWLKASGGDCGPALASSPCAFRRKRAHRSVLARQCAGHPGWGARTGSGRRRRACAARAGRPLRPPRSTAVLPIGLSVITCFPASRARVKTGGPRSLRNAATTNRISCWPKTAARSVVVPLIFSPCSLTVVFSRSSSGSQSVMLATCDTAGACASGPVSGDGITLRELRVLAASVLASTELCLTGSLTAPPLRHLPAYRMWTRSTLRGR